MASRIENYTNISFLCSAVRDEKVGLFQKAFSMQMICFLKQFGSFKNY